MPEGRYLGFDFGLRCIGVAAGQLVTKTAAPLSVIRANAGVPDWNEVKTIVNQWQPLALIVGVPYNMDDSESETSMKARAFGEALAAQTQLPVHFVDERLTTREAKQIAALKPKKKRNERVDGIAAKLILETWLQEH